MKNQQIDETGKKLLKKESNTDTQALNRSKSTIQLNFTLNADIMNNSECKQFVFIINH